MKIARGGPWPSVRRSRPVPEAITYELRRPEATTCDEVVRDNLETLYGALVDGTVEPLRHGRQLRNYGDGRKTVPYRLTVGTACYDFTGSGHQPYGAETPTENTGNGDLHADGPCGPTGTVALDPATTGTVCCP